MCENVNTLISGGVSSFIRLSLRSITKTKDAAKFILISISVSSYLFLQWTNDWTLPEAKITAQIYHSFDEYHRNFIIKRHLFFLVLV